jgi:haloacetate dehalogenase
MFDEFDELMVPVAANVELRVRRGGSGPPVVLLHGHPRTHTTWYRVAPLLVWAGFTVVCRDLRGYGQSSKPPSTADHAPYSKRAMAGDIRTLMRALGYERFAVVGHDRGSYVAFRLAMDVPEAVTYHAVLDSVPIAEALRRADARFATACTVHAMLEDYRAGLGVDRLADEADRAAGRHVSAPTLVQWR